MDYICIMEITGVIIFDGTNHDKLGKLIKTPMYIMGSSVLLPEYNSFGIPLQIQQYSVVCLTSEGGIGVVPIDMISVIYEQIKDYDVLVELIDQFELQYEKPGKASRPPP